MTNHYRTLGVSPDAEEVVIRSAYLALIRRYHPDRGGTEADPSRAQAITAAWEVLRDPARRAAYDDARRARFQPESGGVIVAGGQRVRGGAAARNLFLLLAAGTIGLGWWALQQPLGGPPATTIASSAQPQAVRPAPPSAEAAATPPAAAPETSRALAEGPPLPRVPDEPVADEMVLPPLPETRSPRLPVRAADVQAPERRQAATAPPPPPVRTAAAAARAPVAAAARPAESKAARGVDLAPLERHLQLLTDQSYQYADQGRRSRLFATRGAFLDRLRACADDACKRDAYLRRNQEVAEIMRK